MLPAYMTRAAIAAARYGPPAYRVAKRALSAGAAASATYEMLRGRKKTRAGSSKRATSGPSAVKLTRGNRGVPYTRGLKRGRKGKGTRNLSKKRSSRRKSRSVVDYIGKGAIACDETLGTVTDPDVTYLYVHDTCPNQTYKCVSEALVRKIFGMAFKKSFISSYENLLSGQGTGLGAVKYQLEYIYVNTATGASTNSNISIDQNSTIDNVASALISVLEHVGLGDGVTKITNNINFTNMTVLKNIYSAGGVAIVDQFIMAQLNLLEEVVHLKVKTVTKVQNRSVASDGGVESDNVNMTPLEAYNMRFSGIPKHKYLTNFPVPGTAAGVTGGHLFEQVNGSTGHLTVRGASLDASGSNGDNWLKAQTPSNFQNCKGSKKTGVAPGAIMIVNQSYEKAMNFNTYLKKIMKRNITIAGPPAYDYVSETVGGGNMLCFQDMININTTYNMTLTFQIDRETKACLVSKPKRTWVRKFATSTFNNP